MRFHGAPTPGIYSSHSEYLRMTKWVGNLRDKLFPHFSAVADFAGDVDTQRSTSGFYSLIRGLNRSCPISAGSKRQTCVPHSTPEAELVATDWRVLFPHQTPTDGQKNRDANQSRLVNIRISTAFKHPSACAQPCSPAAPLIDCTRGMATRSDDDIIRAQVAESGAKLQAAAERNHQRAGDRKKAREEAAAATASQTAKAVGK